MRFVNAPRLGVEVDARPSVLVAQCLAQEVDRLLLLLVRRQVPVLLQRLRQLHRFSNQLVLFGHGPFHKKAGHLPVGGLCPQPGPMSRRVVSEGYAVMACVLVLLSSLAPGSPRSRRAP